MSPRELFRRIAFLWHRERHMDDLDAEMQLHRELRAAKLRRDAAVAPEEAVYAAARQFGNQTLLKEISGNMWSWTWIDDLLKDIRHTVRMLAANPLFSLVAIATLALGIGANTAIFSVTNALLLKSLPVHDPQQLFNVHVEPGQPNGASNTGNGNSSFSEYVFEQLRTRKDAFSTLAAYVPLGFDKIAVRAGSAPEEATVNMASGDFFSGLGVAATCGRTFTMADERDHAAVAVISYAMWNRRFEGSCSSLGRTLYVKGIPFTVVGVLPREFPGLEGHAIDVWVPLQNRPELNAWGAEATNYYADPKWWCLRLIARLAPGVDEKRASAILDPVFQRAAYEHLGGKPRKGETPRKLAWVTANGIGDSAEGYAKPLYVLMAMVGVILVIACGNVSMLLAARNAARQREFSLRMAIGGSRARLFRQLLAESLVLVGAGTALGWLLAFVATNALAAWSSIEISLAPDVRVLWFTVSVALLAALIFGLAPLAGIMRTPAALSLKSSASTSFRDKSKSRGGRTIVALQVALCLVLLVGAGLLVGTLRNLERINLGMKMKGLMVFGLNPQFKAHSDAEAIRFFEGLTGKLRALPGVEAVTLMDNRIGSGWSNNTNAAVDGRDPREAGIAQSSQMRWNAVGADYFTTLGIPVRMGRDFTESDSATAPKVAVVNETFAKRYLPGRDPLGHQVSFTRDKSFTIVGVVASSKYTSVRERDIPMAYFPYTQVGQVGALNIELRIAGDPSAFWLQVRRAVGEYAPELPLLRPMTQQAQFDDSISGERLVARLAMCFGFLAVLLVATGLYGTLAYNVRRRTSELGVRMAIGAQPRELLCMVLRESLWVAAVGIVIGLPCTLAATRALESQLYGLAPSDPVSFSLGILGILLVTLAASLVPALRAASMDPVVALRYE